MASLASGTHFVYDTVSMQDVATPCQALWGQSSRFFSRLEKQYREGRQHVSRRKALSPIRNRNAFASYKTLTMLDRCGLTSHVSPYFAHVIQ